MGKRVAILLTVSALLAGGAVPSGAKLGQEMALVLGPQEMTVSGVTPFGWVVVFGVSRVGMEAIVRSERYDLILEDVDGDGSVELGLGETLPERSVWLAIDLTSGSWTATYPQSFPGGGTIREQSIKLTETTVSVPAPSGLVELMMVRRASSPSAWVVTAGDGGEHDLGGPDDGSAEVRLGYFEPLAGSPQVPSVFVPGDQLLVIDPTTLLHGVAVKTGF